MRRPAAKYDETKPTVSHFHARSRVPNVATHIDRFGSHILLGLVVLFSVVNPYQGYPPIYIRHVCTSSGGESVCGYFPAAQTHNMTDACRKNTVISYFLFEVPGLDYSSKCRNLPDCC